jgi:Mn-containing catalase
VGGERAPLRPAILWDIYLSIGAEELGHVGMLVAIVEAADENEAIEKAPAWSKQSGRKVMAVPAHRDGDPFWAVTS